MICRALISTLLAVLCIACGSSSPGQTKSADYIAVFPTETDKLHLIVTRGSLELSGYFDISAKGKYGAVKTKRIPITGTVSTDGVPAGLTIPSSVVGVPDLSLGIFFDRDLNLQLVGDNNRPFPHRMRRVK